VTIAAAPIPAEVVKRSTWRAVAAAAIGNAFEWYDFTVYVLFAPYIAATFFPGGTENEALLKAFLVFGVGFIARPLGGVLIGYFGDRVGRKAALTLTFGLMAVGTLMIAVTPGTASIGAAAGWFVVVGRLLQGLSAGGEIGGAASFLIEYAPPGRRAVFAAFLQASMAVSNILAASMALAIGNFLSPEAVAAWGWRLPFFFGLLIVPVGLWLRASLDETPAFVAEQDTGQEAPVLAVLRTQGGPIARGFGLSVLWGVCTYALIVYMPVHAQKALGYSPDQAFAAALIGNVALIGVCFVSGQMADRFGRRTLLAGAALALAVISPLVMAIAAAVHSFVSLLFAEVALCTLAGFYAGAMPATLAEMYPVRARATSTSIAYNAAFTIFGGFAPAIITLLIAQGVGPQAPTLYVSAAAVISLMALRGLRPAGI